MHFTLFFSKGAQTKAEYEMDWFDLCEKIAAIPEFPNRDSCPWISLARYGETPNENGCLRYAANVLAITGLEGDYDGERVSIDDAAQMARAADIRALFYTTPSYMPLRPRWRVLAPLSREYELINRERFVSRLNGALGGILAPESWARSQAFRIGRVPGVPYRTIRV